MLNCSRLPYSIIMSMVPHSAWPVQLEVGATWPSAVTKSPWCFLKSLIKLATTSPDHHLSLIFAPLQDAFGNYHPQNSLCVRLALISLSVGWVDLGGGSELEELLVLSVPPWVALSTTAYHHRTYQVFYLTSYTTYFCCCVIYVFVFL